MLTRFHVRNVHIRGLIGLTSCLPAWILHGRHGVATAMGHVGNAEINLNNIRHMTIFSLLSNSAIFWHNNARCGTRERIRETISSWQESAIDARILARFIRVESERARDAVRPIMLPTFVDDCDSIRGTGNFGR